MKQYLELGQRILDEGALKSNRTGIKTLATFGSQMRFDLTGGKVAAVTTKKLHLKSVIHELIWMISGSTNVKYLQDNGVRIWNEWADDNGELGPVYGKQWRDVVSLKRFGLGVVEHHIDQLASVIEQLKTNPDDRRLIVSAWNVSQIEDMNLPPCHMMFQFFSRPCEKGGKRKLSLQIYQRSVDYFLGLPFNCLFYSILCHAVAQVTGHEAEELIHIGGDLHIYENHVKQVKQQLKRKPKDCEPKVVLNPEITCIDDFKFEDFEITDYDSHPHIAGKVAV